MPLPAPYAGGHPLGDVIHREIARRRRGYGVEPGAAHLEGLFLRFEGASVLGARPWGPEGGAWILFVRRPTQWSSVEPWLDLRGLNLAAPRSVAPGAPQPRDRRTSYRQLRLAFPGDELARAWNERAAALPDALLPVPDWAVDQAARLPPDRQWRILQFLNATRERGRDLCHSNLPLAFLLASRGEAAGIRAVEAVSWRQRRILGALGLPGQEAAVRVLRRVDDRLLGSPLLAHLGAWMSEPGCLRRLAHVPRIGPGGLALQAAGELAWFDDRALPEVLGADDPETVRSLHEFAVVARRLRQLGYGSQRPLSSAAQIRDRHRDHAPAAAGAGGPPGGWHASRSAGPRHPRDDRADSHRQRGQPGGRAHAPLRAHLREGCPQEVASRCIGSCGRSARRSAWCRRAASGASTRCGCAQTEGPPGSASPVSSTGFAPIPPRRGVLGVRSRDSSPNDGQRLRLSACGMRLPRSGARASSAASMIARPSSSAHVPDRATVLLHG